VLVTVLSLSACERNLGDFIDSDLKLTREDFRKVLAPQPPKVVPAKPAPPIPELSPIIGVEELNIPADARLVSLSVDESASIKDVLVALGREAEIDMHIDPEISGKIIFTARQRPFEEVVRRIATLARLRYTMENNVLSIERDLPFYVNYRVDFLSVKRTSKGSVTTSAGTAGNVSSSALDSESSIDSWQELQQNLEQIIANSSATTGLSAQQAKTFFTVNKQGGMVSVFATQRQHRIVKSYLDKLGASLAAQVLIEAKVVEVSLTRDYETGINWSSLFKTGFNIAAPFGTQVTALAQTSPFPTPSTATTGLLTITNTGRGRINFIMNLLENFGTVRALSSPRLTVMQNQTAILKVAENKVFFQLEVETTAATDNTPEKKTVTSTILTVPVGIILTVQPSINLETQEITLTIRPTVTRIVSTVEDPGVAIESSNTVTSSVPEVSVQEMDSVVTLASGEVLAMGGLMQDRITSTDKGIPGLSAIPWLGTLFKASDEAIEKIELVILLRATILRDKKVSSYELDFVRKFGGDRRPYPVIGP